MNFQLYFKYYLSILFTGILVLGNAQYIEVDTRPTPEELVKNIFFGAETANCISVENITINGYDFGREEYSWGYFNKNGSSFEMDDGIILSSGNAYKAVGPNSYIQSEGTSAWLGDSDLENALEISLSHNATILEFDFTVKNNNIRNISFDYLFASEQYLLTGKASQCSFTDGFAFLIKEAVGTDSYRNLAVIPGTNIPIKSNNVRGPGGLCPPVNEQYFGQYNQDESPINFNGQTKILTAATPVIPYVKYRLKLIIADQGNPLYDSAVFLKAGSFIGIKDLGPDLVISSQTALCEGSTTLLNAYINTVSATYQWYNSRGIIDGATSSTYRVSEEGIYDVLIDDGGCKFKGSIKVEYAEKPIFKVDISVCNYNEGKPISIYLQEWNNKIISNYKPYFKIQYYKDIDDAMAGNDKTIDTLQYDEDTTIYVRAKSSKCDAVIGSITFKSPKKSKTFVDKVICPGTTTTLQAEMGFKYYKWMRENGTIIAEGSNVHSITNVSIGKYSLELTSTNGCTIPQTAVVSAYELPEITNIEVVGNTGTVFITGGTPPYKITNSWNSEELTNSNVFTNIPRGLHTVFVTDQNGCKKFEYPLLILNLINVITPNGDGKNDVLDYSDLSIKKEVKVEIYDRFGNQVFISQKPPYIWDGKIGGNVLPSGTYWYILNWIEPVSNLPVIYKGWVLLKNRE